MSIAVFGIGSPFGDDNIAQQVIELLKQKLSDHQQKNQIQIDYYDRPGIFLLEYMKDIEVLHLVDAMVSQNPLGKIHRYEDISAFQTDNRLLSSHGIGVAEVLELGNSLDCLPRTIIIHGIEIDPNQSIASNSPDIMRSCHTLAAQIALEVC